MGLVIIMLATITIYLRVTRRYGAGRDVSLL
jgi:hypothetical protein